jgi:hypothetical protein
MSNAPAYLMLEDVLTNRELLDPPPVVVPRLAWEGRLTALGSEPKLGKSTLLGQAVAAYVQGRPFLDEPLARGVAVWLALDEPLGDCVRRLAGFGARSGVALVTVRPQVGELEQIIRDVGAKLLVVDTVTEFAAGIVEDGNAAHQWAPLYAQLRALLQRTACAGVLLDHTGKGNPNSLVGSLQKSAGVDQVLTMAGTPDSPNIRHLRTRGRIPCSDFSLSWDGERNTLHTGELSLDTRVFHAVSATPGLSRSKIRERISGKATAVDGAIDALERRGMIEDRGSTGGHAYHVRVPNAGTGSGQGRDRGGRETESDAGQGGTGSGQGAGQPLLSHTLRVCGGQGVGEDEEIERKAIEEEAVA